MRDYLFAALGGALGTAARLGLSRFMQQVLPTAAFPAGTFTVNLTGSFLIGLAAGLFHHKHPASLLPLLLVTGFLGGFTTFSAFSLENLQLLRQGETVTALIYSLLSVSGGLLLAWLGYRLSA